MIRPVLFDCTTVPAGPKVIRGEFWTASQRQMHTLHYVVSYRAAFKPELPDFFIRRLSRENDVVLDPFGGRATTLLQANLLGRRAVHLDVNPISVRIAEAKSHPVEADAMASILAKLDLSRKREFSPVEEDLLTFYSPATLTELINLKKALADHPDDPTLRFIELIALSRLHGHSD